MALGWSYFEIAVVERIGIIPHLRRFTDVGISRLISHLF